MATMRTRAGRKVGTRVDASEFNKLSESLRGRVIRPSDADFNEARTIWNMMIDRKPAVIVQAAGVEDVQQTVNFARAHNMLISIKGGGHNIAGNAVCDDGVMLDMSRMRQIQVNANSKVAYVEPGATLADFDRATQVHGLATPLGINSTTGVAGLTLGGGFGWLTRQHGLTIDNLISADVVLANGKLVTASEEENSDLFWALRGGGGNFGVVTRFTFKLHPVGPNVLAGLVVYPLQDAQQVITRYREFVRTLPLESSVWIVVRLAPPLPFLPAEVHGKPIVAFAVFHNGDPEEGRKNLDPVRQFGTPLGEMIDVMPYVNWQQMFDPMLGPGARNYWKSHNLTDLSPDFIQAVVRQMSNLPAPETDIAFAHIEGVANQKPKDSTAYPHRDAGWAMNIHGRWTDASIDENGINWAREVFKATAPYSTGSVYVNFLTDDEDRIRAAYGDNYDRLLEAKRKYDPENLFCMNQNIDPKG